MPFFGASDIDALLSDTGVVVVVGAVVSRGLEDAPDEDMLGQTSPGLVGLVRVVIVKTGTFALASRGDITVDGVAYKIHKFERLDDGALTRVTCVAAN
jgi:hypothetical protein